MTTQAGRSRALGRDGTVRDRAENGRMAAPFARRDLVQFSFRAPRELRKRANRASIELEAPIQDLVTQAVDEFLRERGF
ncbi:MAG: hypothetical protein ACRDV9_09860 [Acidimicrobiia bacterium]